MIKHIEHMAVAFERSFRFIALLWWIFLIDWIMFQAFGTSIIKFGLAPRTGIGLLGIFTMPFLHANLTHITANTLTLLCVLIPLNLEFSNNKIIGTIFKITVVSGILVWLFGRSNSIHIGASALSYGLILYACIAGWIHRSPTLIAFGFAAIFWSGGSLIAGIFPVDPRVSWEGHLMGAIAGIIIASSEQKEAKS